MPSLAQLLAQVQVKEESRTSHVLHIAPGAIQLRTSKDAYGQPITLNEEQTLSADFGVFGRSFVLTGKAGTGKTTTIQAVMRAMLEKGDVKTWGGKYGVYSDIAVVAFTNKAVRNIHKIICRDPELAEIFSGSVMTIHKLLEFTRTEKAVRLEDGSLKVRPTFEPQRTAENPIKQKVVIIEEASMLGIPLWRQLYAALLPDTQVIFLGDINQLRPVIGESILGHGLIKLPVIELHQVYRQALENPIIRESINCTLGKKISSDWRGEVDHKDGFGIQIHHGKQPGHPPASAWLMMLERYFQRCLDSGFYDPDEDIILCPYFVNPGCERINQMVCAMLDAREPSRPIYHVNAKFEAYRVAVGDRVLVDNCHGYVTEIRENRKFLFTIQPPSPDLGRNPMIGTPEEEELDLDKLLEPSLTSNDEEDDSTNAASHCVTVELETGETRTLSTCGQFNGRKFIHGYAMTVHKSQGSEYEKVFLVFHNKHNKMLSREMLYTGMTRARSQLVIIAKSSLIESALARANSKGDTLKEKIAYFNSKGLKEKVDWAKLRLEVSE
jgi:exodeoxyribonuclease V alpha subunit